MLTETQFIELYTRSFCTIRSFCARFDYENSEDLAQEVFSIVWNKRNEFRGLSRPSTWAHAIALNVIRNKHRKEMKRELVSLDGVEPEFRSTQYSHVLAGQLMARMSPNQARSMTDFVSGIRPNSQYERNLRYRARQRALRG